MSGRQTTVRDFNDFYRAEFTGLVVLAVAVTGQRLGAEDLVQEAMLDAYLRWNRIGAYDAPRAWVRRVLVQRAVKASKKNANATVAESRSLRFIDPGGENEALDPELRDALLALPTQQRAAMALHYLEDISLREVAEILRIAEGTVKSHLSRGRLSLRRMSLGRTPEKNEVGQDPSRSMNNG